jgi:hypothetical protein
MKLLANENFPAASVQFLRNCGYDVSCVAENLKSILIGPSWKLQQMKSEQF